MPSLSASHKRQLAGAWFAGVALLSVVLLFHSLAIAPQGIFLYIGLPTMAAAVAGLLWGGRILNPAKISTVSQSMLAGIVIAAGAFVIFSLLYSVSLPFTERGWSLRQSGGLFLLTSTLGILLAGPVVLLGGMLAGMTLHLLGRRFSGNT
jgi:hypothetical protein